MDRERPDHVIQIKAIKILLFFFFYTKDIETKKCETREGLGQILFQDDHFGCGVDSTVGTLQDKNRPFRSIWSNLRMREQWLGLRYIENRVDPSSIQSCVKMSLRHQIRTGQEKGSRRDLKFLAWTTTSFADKSNVVRKSRFGTKDNLLCTELQMPV